MHNQITRTPEEIERGEKTKKILSSSEISQGNIEFNDNQKVFHVIDSTSESLKSLMNGNGRLSGYYAEQYLRMTDKIPTEFRPLMAIIESYDIPRMKLLEDNVCVGGLSSALQYAKDNDITNIEDFLIGLKDYFSRLVEMNQNDSTQEYFIDQIKKGINFINLQLM